MRGKLITQKDGTVKIELFVEDAKNNLQSIGTFDINPKYKDELWYIQSNIYTNAEILIDLNEINKEITEEALNFFPSTNDTARLKFVLEGLFYKKI